ncbi:MAG: class I SAM-dependent methyltransferase [Anaerolineae bacterium]|nr:class I SAM-dependent methyltransferase [Phycisphaerae bacterium]
MDTSPLIAEGHYARKQIGCRSRIISFSHGSRFRMACRLVEPFVGTSVLDYGCGDGSFLAMVADKFPVAVGADVDAKQNADCAARFASLKHVSFVHTSALNDPANEARYRVVACMETLEHVTEEIMPIVLSDLRRCLAADGTLIISVPIEIGPTLPLKQMMRRIAGWRKLGDYAGSERYTVAEITKMTFAGSHTQIVRPAYSSPDGAFHAHKGFNWRRLRERLRESFTIRQTRFTPFAWSGGLISSQAWFICGHR